MATSSALMIPCWPSDPSVMSINSERSGEVRLYIDVRQRALHPQPAMSDTSPTLALLGAADLAARWGYTRQGVHQLAARPGFPAPAAAVNGGRVRVWLLADVEAFERGRPELGDHGAKRNKQRGYHLARTKGRQGQAL